MLVGGWSPTRAPVFLSVHPPPAGLIRGVIWVRFLLLNLLFLRSPNFPTPRSQACLGPTFTWRPRRFLRDMLQAPMFPYTAEIIQLGMSY